MTATEQPQAEEVRVFEQWAIVELYGHVKMAGRVTEEDVFGKTLGRIDIPAGESFITQYFGGGSVYRLTPCSEEAARQVARAGSPPAIYRLELTEAKARDFDYEDREPDDWEDPF